MPIKRFKVGDAVVYDGPGELFSEYKHGDIGLVAQVEDSEEVSDGQAMLIRWLRTGHERGHMTGPGYSGWYLRRV